MKELKKGDILTIEGTGYNKKGQLCIDGRRLGITRGRKNKIVELKQFKVTKTHK